MMLEDAFRLALVSAAWPLAIAVVAAGCSSTRLVEIEVPPRVELGARTVGLVNFTGSPADKLSQTTTQGFMAAIHAAQPNVRFLELGTMDQVLRTIGRDRMDPEAIRTIGQRHRVDVVLTGGYEISDAKPKVSVDQNAVRAATWVHIAMTARLWDTKDGATVWTNTRNGDWPLSKLRIEPGQMPTVSLGDSEERYGGFMRQLVRAVTEDFRPTYETRRVAK